jgi:hypothetical protein
MSQIKLRAEASVHLYVVKGQASKFANLEMSVLTHQAELLPK